MSDNRELKHFGFNTCPKGVECLLFHPLLVELHHVFPKNKHDDINHETPFGALIKPILFLN